MTAILQLPALFLWSLLQEESACVAAGLAVGYGELSWGVALPCCFAGVLTGDLLLLGAGRLLRTWPWLERRTGRWAEAAERVARQWGVAEHGPWLAAICRFVPLTRTPLLFSIGALERRFALCAALMALSAAVYTLGVVGLAAWLGREVQEHLPEYRQWAAMGVIGLVLTALAARRLWGGRGSRGEDAEATAES